MKNEKFIFLLMFIIFIIVIYLYKNNLDLQKLLESKNEKFEIPYTIPYLPSPQENIYNNFYPNLTLPATVIGGGRRREFVYGGSEQLISNSLPPINISNQNISPINIQMTNFNDGNIRQIGTIQKNFGDNNDVYPLFGRQKYRNSNQWIYWCPFGKYGVILQVHQHRNFEELQNNDTVFIEGQKDEYRVIIYDQFLPSYY